MDGKTIVVEVREATELDEKELAALAITGERADKLAEETPKSVPVISTLENVPGDGSILIAVSVRWGQGR